MFQTPQTVNNLNVGQKYGNEYYENGFTQFFALRHGYIGIEKRAKSVQSFRNLHLRTITFKTIKFN